MLSFRNARGCEISTWIQRCWFSAGSLLAGVAIGVCVQGCGSGSAEKTSKVDSNSAAKAAKSQHTVDDEHVEKEEHVEKAGYKKKPTSNIPYDAFEDDPLAVAQNNAIVANAAPAEKAAPAPAEKTMPDKAAPAAAGGAPSWNDFISTDGLQDELKKIRNRLTASLAGQGTYNGNYKDIAVDGAVIAALASIVIENGSDVSWKTNAPHIRNLGYELSQAATGLGKDSYEKSKTAFDKLQSVFSGTVPADAGTAAPKRPFGEVADRSGLMKRIEKARNWMKDNINNDAKLKGETEAILHEASLISTLGKIVTTESYGSTEEADYQNFAKSLIEGAQEASAAAKDQSLKKFTDAMNKVSKSCDQCHANYGNG